jgi:hypothetical protein
MSAETWCMPSSRSTSFSAEKIGRSGQPVQKPGGARNAPAARAHRRDRRGGRRGRAPGTGAGAGDLATGDGGLRRAPHGGIGRRRGARQPMVASQAAWMPGQPRLSSATVYSPAIGSMSLPCIVGPAMPRAGSVGGSVRGSPAALPRPPAPPSCRLQKRSDLVVDHRVGDVHHVQRHARLAPNRSAMVQALQRAQHVVVHAALRDDADVVDVAVDELVEAALGDELQRRRPALRASFSCSCRNSPAAARYGWCRAPGSPAPPCSVKAGLRLGSGDEAAVQVAGADAQLQHHRRVRGLRQREAVVHRLHDRRQVGPRVEQPDLRLHREGVAALLHDAGAFAVVLADDDQRAAGDAARGQVGQRVRRDVGADGGLPGDRAAHRVVHRCRQRGGGGGFAGAAGSKCTPSSFQDRLGIGQHVHQVRDRRALVAGDVADAAFEQRLGDGEDALATELGAVRHAQLLNFLGERALGHVG